MKRSEREKAIPDLSTSVLPFDYNPSVWSQPVPIVILAGIAFLISTYMDLYQWRLIPEVWDPISGEGTRMVPDSDVSEIFRRWMRVPDAAPGAGAYFGDAIYGLAGMTRSWQ